MTFDIASLNGTSYDVLVIGGGSVGIGSTLAFAAAGSRVLMVEKGDFGSGTTSRSSRVINCGLLYLAPNNATMWQLLGRPRQVLAGFREAARFMRARTAFARNHSHLTRTARACFPVYRSGTYRGWQVDIAFKLLRLLDIGGHPLRYRRLSRKAVTQMPLIQWLRDGGDLESVATYDEVLADWPERLMYDEVVRARSLGATALNYVQVESGQRTNDGTWKACLREMSSGRVAEVTAKSIVNAAGVWIDEVNGLFARDVPRTMVMSKGTHIVVKLPEACAEFGIVTVDGRGRPMTILPFRGLHVIGSTWGGYDGDPDTIQPTPAEVTDLVEQANHVLPGLGLSRRDVLYGWTGLRSFGYDLNVPAGRRGFVLHGPEEHGLADLVAVTGSPVTTYRDAGRRIARFFTGSSADRGIEGGSPTVRSVPDSAASSWAHAARTEDVTTVIDLLFRRTGEGWNADLGQSHVEQAVDIAGDALGWDAARRARELTDYLEYVRLNHQMS